MGERKSDSETVPSVLTLIYQYQRGNHLLESFGIETVDEIKQILHAMDGKSDSLFENLMQALKEGTMSHNQFMYLLAFGAVTFWQDHSMGWRLFEEPKNGTDLYIETDGPDIID
jgi:hypothetical protein